MWRKYLNSTAPAPIFCFPRLALGGVYVIGVFNNGALAQGTLRERHRLSAHDQALPNHAADNERLGQQHETLHSLTHGRVPMVSKSEAIAFARELSVLRVQKRGPGF